jgi:flagellar biosynthesis component FlhA
LRKCLTAGSHGGISSREAFSVIMPACVRLIHKTRQYSEHPRIQLCPFLLFLESSLPHLPQLPSTVQSELGLLTRWADTQRNQGRKKRKEEKRKEKKRKEKKRKEKKRKEKKRKEKKRKDKIR